MTELLHEVWEQPTDDGQWLDGCCLAGPDGDGFRSLLPPGSRLVHTFSAGSHFETMTKLYEWRGCTSPYTTIHNSDLEPYPTGWLERQKSATPSK